MARITFDFQSDEQAKRFPCHGWARNAQGIKLLWLPILNLLRDPEGVRRSKGTTRPLPPNWQNTSAFYEKIRTLTVALRELHRLVHNFSEIPIQPETSQQRDEQSRILEMVPLFLRISYIDVRSLADLLARYSQLVLFEKYGCMPLDFSGLTRAVADRRQLARVRPFQKDTNALQAAFKESSRWFDLLRHPEGGDLGLRDAMIHGAVRTLIGGQQAGDKPPEISVFLVSETQELYRERELISTLRTVMEGLCQFCTRFHTAVGFGEEYTRPDYLFLTGNDGDIAGFWPEL